MDGEQLLIDGGIVAGFLALITFWIGIAMWMWADAEKHGRAGWFWSYVGLLGGPVGLVGYLLHRDNRPAPKSPVAPPVTLPVASSATAPVITTEPGIESLHHLSDQTKLD